MDYCGLSYEFQNVVYMFDKHKHCFTSLAFDALCSSSLPRAVTVRKTRCMYAGKQPRREGNVQVAYCSTPEYSIGFRPFQARGCFVQRPVTSHLRQHPNVSDDTG